MNCRAEIVFRVRVPVIFPEGVHPGAGGKASLLMVERDGSGQPILRGSAVAGVLRSAYASSDGASDAAVWFGEAVREDAFSNPSRIVAEDARFSLKNGHVLPVMTHNAIIRHTRAVYESALFSEERIPPGAKTAISLAVTCPADELSAAESFIKDIVALFEGGLFFGGAVARGMGRAVVTEEGASWKKYVLSDMTGAVEWLDDQYTLRQGRTIAGMSPLRVKHELSADALRIELVLRLGWGQDLLVAEGHEMYPMKRQHADGQEHWVLPGSSLRGLLRGWISRLAAREGLPVADDAARYQSDGPMDVALLGWGGEGDAAVRKTLRDAPDLLECPVMRLFGSLYAKGRVHVSDAYAKVANEGRQAQRRKHVAVDRFSGGANEGALFDNYVLVGEDLRFPAVITVVDPEEREVRWLAQALKALDLGLIRFGSSKASGRMTFEKPVRADGKMSEMFVAEMDRRISE